MLGDAAAVTLVGSVVADVKGGTGAAGTAGAGGRGGLAEGFQFLGAGAVISGSTAPDSWSPRPP